MGFDLNDTNMIYAMIDAAFEARTRAYAPYSKHYVGAAVLGENGKIYSGGNIENISYGLTVCGERAALLNMNADGCHRAEVLLVTSSKPKPRGMPCMACLQFMADFVDLDIPIIAANKEYVYYVKTYREVFPYPFLAFSSDAS